MGELQINLYTHVSILKHHIWVFFFLINDVLWIYFMIITQMDLQFNQSMYFYELIFNVNISFYLLFNLDETLALHRLHASYIAILLLPQSRKRSNKERRRGNRLIQHASYVVFMCTSKSPWYVPTDITVFNDMGTLEALLWR